MFPVSMEGLVPQLLPGQLEISAYILVVTMLEDRTVLVFTGLNVLQ